MLVGDNANKGGDLFGRLFFCHSERERRILNARYRRCSGMMTACHFKILHYVQNDKGALFILALFGVITNKGGGET
jgi:hypothetical protein